MATNDVYKVTVSTSIASVVANFHLHYRETSNVTDSDRANTFANEWATAFTTQLRAVLSSSAQFQSVYCRIVTPAFNVPGLNERIDETGTKGADALPANSCQLYSIQSDDPQLERAGRIYVSGGPKDQLSGGNWSALFVGVEMEAFRAKLQSQTSFGVIDAELGILRTIDNGLPIIPPLFIPADRVAVSGIAYSQRRRTGRRRGVTA